MSGQSKLMAATLDTRLVPSPAGFTVLLPPEYQATGKPLPLLYILHGGNGDNEFLARTIAPLLEKAWRGRLLPPLVAVTPDARRSFYLDYRDGSERWETFILDELLPYLRRTYNLIGAAQGTALCGISMGGMGALRMAFKHPQSFAAVAALEPGIEPALSFAEIKPRDRFWRSQALFEEKYGSPIDEGYWQANNPANLALNHSAALRASGLQIYLEVGDEDSFYLHHGAEFLHRVLFDREIKHEYRLVRGANHLGQTLPARFLDAFSFIGRVLEPPPPDDLSQLHQMIATMKRQSGYSGE